MQQNKKFNEWPLLFILTPLVISVALSMDIYVPCLTNIMHDFGVKEIEVQWTLGIYMFGVGLTQLLAGPITDCFSRRKIVLTGLIIYILGSAICVFANSVDILILGRLLESIGSCCAIVIAYAVAKDRTAGVQSTKMFSYLTSTTMLAPIFAPILGGYLAICADSWRAPFAFLLGYGVFSLIIVYFLLAETLLPSQRIQLKLFCIFKNILMITQNKSFIYNGLYTVFALIILFSFCGISSFLLMYLLGISKQFYGLCFGTNAIFFIAGSFLCIKIGNKYFPHRAIFWGAIFLTIGGLMMLILNYFFGLSVACFILPMFIVTLGLGLFMGPATSNALADCTNVAGTASSLLTGMQFLSAGLIGNFLIKHSLTSALPFAAMIFLMGLILIIIYLYYYGFKNNLKLLS